MPFHGACIQCSMLEGGIAEMRFDLQDDTVNKFSQATLAELRQAVAALQADPAVKGLLVTSGKDWFAVGADVTEFLGFFALPEPELVEWVMETHRLFSAIEDLPFPSVIALNGFTMGGGTEFALTMSYRVMAADARIGLPETKLGIFPGWGGTVRLARVAGAENAIEWIAGGDHHSGAEALAIGLADAVVAPAQLREAALDLLGQAIAGTRDWKARQRAKAAPLKLNEVEARMVFEVGRGAVAARTLPNYPAPVAALDTMRLGAGMGRDEALHQEAVDFARIAKTPTARSLVNIFLADKEITRIAKKLAKNGAKVRQAAVLGAGIMGGGVAYQSASKGTPILMKDINEKALALGWSEAGKLLGKLVEKGRMTPAKMADALGRIRPTLSYGDFPQVDLAVEAVVENEQVKKSVLAELEGFVPETAVLASNTSTISITTLAEALQRPENFCGMHFFNPVPRMPLVEIIRGAKTSEQAVATAVGYALAMGKTPIVVNDCPGFLVNRILFPYLAGFNQLVADGVDFTRIDRVMEQFGWPMGPAYLLDVVGIDTAKHAGDVMARGFPDRMAFAAGDAINVMFEAGRYGQKNGQGYYRYVPDKRGIPRKELDPAAEAIVAAARRGDPVEVTDAQIVDRMMLPLIIECSRCLEDGIVATPVEVDTGLVCGLGFPTFRGGALRYADSLGAAELVRRAEGCKSLGKLYEPTAQMLRSADQGGAFYEER